MLRRILTVCLACAIPVAAPAQAVGVLSDSAARVFYRQHATEYADESRAMAPTSGRVSRTAGQLKIKLRNGRIQTLLDTLAEGDSHHRFLYSEYIRGLGLHHVTAWYYEGSTHLLIRESDGKTVFVPGSPIFSPDRRHFVSASLDLEAMYNPNRLEVWTVSIRGVRQEFAVDGAEKWGPDSVRWISNSLIQYSRKAMNQGSGEVHYAPRWLVRSAQGWRVMTHRP